MPPHLRGKPGSGDDRPPPEPRRDDFDRGGRSGNFYYILEYVVMWRKFVLVSQKRLKRSLVLVSSSKNKSHRKANIWEMKNRSKYLGLSQATSIT